MSHNNIIERSENIIDALECVSLTLMNNLGMEVTILNFGATITSIKIPIENKLTDIVLGFENVADYLASFNNPGTPYFGSVIGRFAGRINKGLFSLNGETIRLNQNFYGHHIHGGQTGFSNAFWDVKEIKSGSDPSVTFVHTSQDGEENYPGKVVVEVKYTLTENNELKIEYEAVSDKDTIVNLTQHSYFNLDGHQGDVANQELFINSDKILETDDENIPTGKFIELFNHHFDFRKPKSCPHKIDNSFALSSTADAQAVLSSTKNKLKMSVFTNQPCLQVYVGGAYDGKLKIKEGARYHDRSGICFEAQHFPDSPNHPEFPSVLLKKGELYHHHTLFRLERM